MKENFEIEKELKFNSNLYEILSISLEEKHDIVNSKIVGNFFVSGEYKVHEISLNKEKFNFKIPYEYGISSDIDVDSIRVDITNFIYDVMDSTLYVTIAYDVVGERKDILLFDDEEDLDEFLKSREVEFVMDEMISDIEECQSQQVDEVIDELEKIIEEDKGKKEVLKKEEVSEELHVDCERNIEAAKENLLNSIKVEDDTYITYQIHIVKESDSLESILVKYNISLEELKEYNDFNSLSLGMKLIIPVIHEK